MTQKDTLNPIITLKNVSYYYTSRMSFFKKERLWVLRDVSIDIHPGETLGIIGRNGAGKTTLLKLVAGILDPDKGHITNRGVKTSLLSLQAGFVPYLSGRENTYLSGMILGMKKHAIREKINSVRAFSGLGDFFDQPIISYSTGMKARLGFSIGLELNTDVLLIDEIMGVGDGEFRKKSTDRMKQKITSNRTVLLVSHSPTLVRELSDRVLWIENGKTEKIGNPDPVLSEYEIYLRCTKGLKVRMDNKT